MICVLNSFPDFTQQWKFTPRTWRLVIYFAYGSVKAWSVSSIVSFSDSMKALLFVSHPDLVTCLFHFQTAWKLCRSFPTLTWSLISFIFRQHEGFAVLLPPGLDESLCSYCKAQLHLLPQTWPTFLRLPLLPDWRAGAQDFNTLTKKVSTVWT